MIHIQGKSALLAMMIGAGVLACSGDKTSATEAAYSDPATDVPSGAAAGSGAVAVTSRGAGIAAAVDSRAASAVQGTDQGNQQALCSDADVAAIVSVLNAGEIKESMVVKDRDVAPAVRDFANRMITDHTRLQARADQVLKALGITPHPNDVSKELADDADTAAAKFASMNGTELDRDFIAHEVVDHLQSLAVVQELAIPSVQAPLFRAALLEARAVIFDHYQMALRIERDLAGACGSNDTGGGGTDAGCGTDTDAGTSADAGTSTDAGSCTHCGG